MSKLKKISVIFLFGLLVIIAAGYFLFNIILSPERMKNLVEQRASSALGAEVKINKTDLSPGVLRLEDIAIYSAEEERNLIATIEKAHLSFEITSFLKGEYVFNDIRIYEPQVSLTEIPPAGTSEILAPAMAGLTGEGGVFSFNSFQISEGTLNLSSPRISVSNIDILLKLGSLHEAVLLEASALFSDSPLSSVSLISEIYLMRNKAEIKEINISAYGGEIEGRGSIKELLPALNADIEYNVTEFPVDLFNDNLNISGSSDINGTYKLKDGESNLELKSDFQNASLEAEDIFNKPLGEVLRFQCGISYSGKAGNVDWYILNVGGSTFSGTGIIHHTEKAQVNINADNMDLENLGRFFPGFRKHVLSGDAELQSRANLEKGNSSFTGEVSATEMRVRKVPVLSDVYARIVRDSRNEFLFNDFSSNFFIDNRKLQLKSLNFEGPNFQGSGSGEIMWTGELDLLLYPNIRGSSVGIRVSGRKDNMRISLE